LNFRVAITEDAVLVADLGRKTFSQAFRDMNDPVDFDAYVSHAFDLKQGFEVTGEKTFAVGRDKQMDYVLVRNTSTIPVRARKKLPFENWPKRC
jgi:hypothetical protein